MTSLASSTFSYLRRNHRGRFRIEVHPRAVNVIGPHDRYFHSIFVLVAARLHLSEPLRPAVPKPAGLRFSFEAVLLGRRHFTLFGVNADSTYTQEAIDGRQARSFHHVQIHQSIREEHLAVMLHVVADATNFRCEMHNNVGSPANFSAGLWIGQISRLEFNIALDSLQVVPRAVGWCEAGNFHIGACVEQPFYKVRADKSVPPCHDNLFLLPERHDTGDC